VWVIWDPEKSHIGANVWVFRSSKIHSDGARKVIAPVKTVFRPFFKRHPAKRPTEDTPCRIPGQHQVDRLKAGVPSEEQGGTRGRRFQDDGPIGRYFKRAAPNEKPNGGQ
jgi:hypothetical protein